MASKFKPGTLPDHNRCDIHRLHMLGCEQYERLLARCGQCCEVCGLPGRENPRGKLHIDHDGPQWAVRGLLCARCNTMLSTEVARCRPAWTAGYLDNSWWVKECERLGVPTSIASEPEPGGAIRDQFNVIWMREGDGLWRPGGRGRPGITSATWRWLYDHRGPHNTAPLDLYATDEAGCNLRWGHLVWGSEIAALQALLAEVSDRVIPSHQMRAWRGVLAPYMQDAEEAS